MEMIKNNYRENERFFRFLSRFYNFGEGFILKGVKKAIREIDIARGSRILDVGCGTGILLNHLARRSDLELHGIDLSHDMLRVAINRLKGRAILKRGVSEELDSYFEKEYFDYVFVVDAFHHFSDQMISLEKIYKVLKNGGRLIIVDLDFGVVLNKLFNMLEPGNSGMYSKKKIAKKVSSVGFKVNKYKKIGIFSYFILAEKS
jgi:demethylmenaquinone methyltransferase/2-methoxy-6-polyprenyl-1,4-benzoquinol methylase